MDDVHHQARIPAQTQSSEDTALVRVNRDDYEAARRVAELRSETVDDIVTRALRAYGRGRMRSR